MKQACGGIGGGGGENKNDLYHEDGNIMMCYPKHVSFLYPSPLLL
jgi:hypothetical protein